MSAALINAGSLLFHLPTIVRDYILTDEDLRDAALIVEDDRELDTEVNKAMQGLKAGVTSKVGLSVLIQTVQVGQPLHNVPGITYALKNGLLFEIVEVPEINRNSSHSPAAVGIYGRAYAEVLWATMKRFRSTETGWTGVNFYDGEGALAPPVAIPGKPNAVLHSLTLFYNGGIQDTTTLVETPVISGSAATFVTLTCGTAGASIYYTTNSTRPHYFSVGNASNVGTLYTVPFVVSANTVVTARAIKSGLRSSLIAQSTIT